MGEEWEEETVAALTRETTVARASRHQARVRGWDRAQARGSATRARPAAAWQRRVGQARGWREWLAASGVARRLLAQGEVEPGRGCAVRVGRAGVAWLGRRRDSGFSWLGGHARERENRERRVERRGSEERGRERIEERGRENGGGCWLLPGSTRDCRVRVVDNGPQVGRLGVGLVFFFFLKFRNTFLYSSKIHKTSPKLFINNIFIFRLVIVILFNYYIIY
jgi:hypothetical protein